MLPRASGGSNLPLNDAFWQIVWQILKRQAALKSIRHPCSIESIIWWSMTSGWHPSSQLFRPSERPRRQRVLGNHPRQRDGRNRQIPCASEGQAGQLGFRMLAIVAELIPTEKRLGVSVWSSARGHCLPPEDPSETLTSLSKSGGRASRRAPNPFNFPNGDAHHATRNYSLVLRPDQAEA